MNRAENDPQDASLRLDDVRKRMPEQLGSIISWCPLLTPAQSSSDGDKQIKSGQVSPAGAEDGEELHGTVGTSIHEEYPEYERGFVSGCKFAGR